MEAAALDSMRLFGNANEIDAGTFFLPHSAAASHPVKSEINSEHK